MQFRHIPVLVGLMLAVSPAFAQVVHNEAIDGDLSGVGPSPTELVFGVGLNTIQGSFGSAPAGVDGGATNGNDADIFTFTLGAGQSVESITTTRTGAGTLSFIGHSSTSSISDFDDNASLGAAITTGSLFGNGAVTTLTTRFRSMLSKPFQNRRAQHYWVDWL